MSVAQPPVLHYDKYEVYKELQKEIKRIGGQHMGTLSDLTDLDMEVRLLGDYKRWVKAQHTQGEVSDQLLDNGVSFQGRPNSTRIWSRI